MLFVKKYPWGQEVSSYVLVCVVFMLQGGVFVGIRIDLYFVNSFIVPPIVCSGGGVSPLFGRLFSFGLIPLWGRGLRNAVPYG